MILFHRGNFTLHTSQHLLKFYINYISSVLYWNNIPIKNLSQQSHYKQQYKQFHILFLGKKLRIWHIVITTALNIDITGVRYTHPFSILSHWNHHNTVKSRTYARTQSKDFFPNISPTLYINPPINKVMDEFQVKSLYLSETSKYVSSRKIKTYWNGFRWAVKQSKYEFALVFYQ